MERTLSIPGFCKTYGISVATYYRMQKAGKGPRVTKVAGRRLIARDTAEAWLRQCEDKPQLGSAEKNASERSAADVHYEL